MEELTNQETKRLLKLDPLVWAPKAKEIEVQERPTIIETWLKEQQNVLIYGEPGFGKTFFGLHILKAISTGEPLGPWKIAKPCRCLFVDAELPFGELLKERIELVFGKKFYENKNMFLYSDSYSYYCKYEIEKSLFNAKKEGATDEEIKALEEKRNSLPPPVDLTDEKFREYIKILLVKNNIKVWLLDNIINATPGQDLNKKEDWDEIRLWLKHLRFLGITTILIHHSNKSGQQLGTVTRETDVDTKIKIEHPTDYNMTDGVRFVPKFEKFRGKYNANQENVEFQLIDDASASWFIGCKSYPNETLEVFSLLVDGVVLEEIGKRIGKSKTSAIRKKKEIIEMGWLDKDGQVTILGRDIYDRHIDKRGEDY